MAKTPDVNQVATSHVVNVIESFTAEAARNGGKGLVRLFESWLSRIPEAGLKAMQSGGRVAAGLVQKPFERLAPMIGTSKANLLAEAAEAFVGGLATAIGELPAGADAAALRAAAGTEAVRAGEWYKVREDLVASLKAKARNFGPNAMAAFGDEAAQRTVMETVQVGVGMLAASRNPADLQLLTQIDFTSTENIRYFLIATRTAMAKKRRGAEYLTDLSGAAMVITPTDSATPRAIVMLGQNIVGGVRYWVKGIFTAHVNPAVAREWQYTAPTTPPRGWFARMFNPAPSWSFRESNLRMKAEWLGELLRGLVGSWVKLIALTMAIFMVSAALMLIVGSNGHPKLALFFAGFGAFMGYAAFIVNLVYAPLAIDLGRLLVGTPMLVGAAFVNLFRGDDAEKLHASIDPATIQHLRDIRWRVALATLGLPTFLLMAAMIVGPTLNAFVIAFALGGVSAVVSVAAHFVADDALNKKLMRQGTMVGFSLMFAVATASLLNAGTFYRWDTGRQFSEFYRAGMLNVGEMLFYALPVIVLSLCLVATAVWMSVKAFTGKFSSLFGGTALLVVLSLLLYGAMAIWPRRETPIVHVPSSMQEGVMGGAAPTGGSPSGAPASATPHDPWDASYAESVGDF